MFTNNKLSKAVQVALAFGAVTTAFSASVSAQEEIAAKEQRNLAYGENGRIYRPEKFTGQNPYFRFHGRNNRTNIIFLFKVFVHLLNK